MAGMGSCDINGTGNGLMSSIQHIMFLFPSNSVHSKRRKYCQLEVTKAVPNHPSRPLEENLINFSPKYSKGPKMAIPLLGSTKKKLTTTWLSMTFSSSIGKCET